MWNVKHNIIHHAYTNIDGIDDDIDIQPWMRMSSTQKKYALHKYQHRYFWFLYAVLYILWIFVMDYQKYFKQKIGDMPLKTTANFATRNKLISTLVGGLNFQIEHHLFPRISHVHYPAISKIIKATCEEYNVPYIEYPKMRLAVASHVAFLKQMGRG